MQAYPLNLPHVQYHPRLCKHFLSGCRSQQLCIWVLVLSKFDKVVYRYVELWIKAMYMCVL